VSDLAAVVRWWSALIRRRSSIALARRLARSCGGDVSAVASREGGRFLLRLPALT